MPIRGITSPNAKIPEGHYLAVFNGEHPTPGYKFGVIGAELSWSTLQLELSWHQPDDPSKHDEVISTPCAVFEFKNLESVNNIEVILDGKDFANISAKSQ